MKRRRVVLPIILVGLFVLAPFVLYGLRSSSSSRVEMDVPATVAYLHDVPQESQWLLSMKDPSIERDLHTSMQTLREFIIERTVAAVEKVGGGGKPVALVGENVAPDLTRVLHDRLLAAGHTTAKGDAEAPSDPPDMSVETEEASIQVRWKAWVLDRIQQMGGDRQTSVRLRWEDREDAKVSWWPTRLAKGTLVADVRGPKGTATVRATLDEKPWLHTPPSSVGHTGHTVVTSGPPAASKEEAVERARRRAEDVLVSAVYNQAVSVAPAHGRASPSLDDVRRQVRGRFPHRIVADDRCVVRIERPYGAVWFAAELVNVSPAAHVPLATSAVNAASARRQSLAGMTVALGGMVLVLGVVYAALNAITRGYFRGPLRLGAAVAGLFAAAAVLLLMFVA